MVSRLHNEIDWKEKCFRRYNGRCAFLNEEGLCDLYLEGGQSRAFCRTCRMYPRHEEEFEGLREISLSLSCPEAARMILNLEEPVRFLHGENPRRRETYRDFDYLLFTKLMDARAVIFRILQNREQPSLCGCFFFWASLMICSSGSTGDGCLRQTLFWKNTTPAGPGTGFPKSSFS